MNRLQAIELARKIKEIRRNKFKGLDLNYQALLRLYEMDVYEREMAMERLVQKGYADSVDEIKRMLKDKRVCLSVGSGGSPVESTGMSDEVLDAGIQYLDINKELI